MLESEEGRFLPAIPLHAWKIVRSIASLTSVCLAVFAALNIVLSVVSPRLGCNWLWIGISDRPASGGWFLMLFFAAAVLGGRRIKSRLRLAARCVIAVVGAFCLRDAFAYYQLIADGTIRSSFPLPLSLVLGVLLVVRALWPPDSAGKPGLWPRLLYAGLAAWAAGLCLLAQVLAFGATDYSRASDAIVVFGAGVRPDGRPSLALADRTRTGCALLKEGTGRWLVLSGGGSGLASEPQAMKRIALRMGVPESAIILDERGNNTLATVRNVKELSVRHGWSRLLMVSHDYHLSRISMLSHRAGLAVCTVPARESRPLTLKPYYVQRELVAWIYYYLNG